jgi:hypothetical protein
MNLYNKHKNYSSKENLHAFLILLLPLLVENGEEDLPDDPVETIHPKLRG